MTYRNHSTSLCDYSWYCWHTDGESYWDSSGKKGVTITETKNHMFEHSMSQAICLFSSILNITAVGDNSSCQSCSTWLWFRPLCIQYYSSAKSVAMDSCDTCVWNFAFPERIILKVKPSRQGILLELLRVLSGQTSDREKMSKICRLA